MTFELKTWKLHGRPVNYVEAGAGPVLMLVHGMAGSYQNWDRVIAPLAQHHTVIAPDLPGHGASAPGGGDYSIGALATELRDLLIVLGHERATFVGHSLGGGIVMQLAYQFPELTERLVLVSSGGLGSEVSPVLRAAALPGSGLFIAATAKTATRAGSAVSRGQAPLAGVRPPTSPKSPEAMPRWPTPIAATPSWPRCDR
jgi:pimeloyl-ACP methyl ester carboxylesterase